MSKSKAFETALSLVQAEVTAECVAEKLKPIVIEKPIIVEKPVKPSTRIVDMADEQVQTTKTFLDLDGEGTLEKLLIRSPSSNFSIFLATEKATLQGSYANFVDVLAYHEDSTYVLEVTNIEFQRKLRLTITVTESITFSKIFIKYQAAP